MYMECDNHNKATDRLFINNIKEHDIVLLLETHIGYNTYIDIDGFQYYPVCRGKSGNNRYFGGLGILIKRNMRKRYIYIHNTNTEYQCLKLRKDFFNFKKDIYLCLAYIAPQISGISKRQDKSILELIEQDIIQKY